MRRKPLTHEARLAAALTKALQEMQHVSSHGFRCAGLEGAIAQAKQTLAEYHKDTTK